MIAHKHVIHDLAHISHAIAAVTMTVIEAICLCFEQQLWQDCSTQCQASLKLLSTVLELK
jgi:hypothetical protein